MFLVALHWGGCLSMCCCLSCPRQRRQSYFIFFRSMVSHKAQYQTVSNSSPTSGESFASCWVPFFWLPFTNQWPNREIQPSDGESSPVHHLLEFQFDSRWSRHLCWSMPTLTSCGIPAVASTSPFQCVYRYQPFGFSPHLGLQMSPPAAFLRANIGYQRSANCCSTQAPQCQVDQKVGLSTLDLSVQYHKLAPRLWGTSTLLLFDCIFAVQ